MTETLHRIDTPPPEPGNGSGLRRVLPALGSLQGYIGLILVIALGLITQGETFANETNITNAVGAFASRGILAIGVTLVILTAGIDLSVGSLLGLCAMVSAMSLKDHGMSPWQILIVSMLVGALFGFFNGVGTTVFKIQSFVMTLAMMSIARGLDRQLSDNVSVGTQIFDANGKLVPEAEAFQGFGTPGNDVLKWLPGLGGIYYPVLALILVTVVFHLILSKTKFGRHIYAVGGNPTAARLSGVNVVWITIAVFTLSGMLAGFAGPIEAAYSAQADPQAGTTYELDAIAAAVIGGASLAGGRGTVIGTLVGAMILTLLDNVLGLNSVSDNWQLVIKGLIVVVAVVLQRPGFLAGLITPFRRFAGSMKQGGS